MKVIAIIQARMGSTRLPGKVLVDIYGHAMLFHVARRTGAAETLDKVVIATTTEPADDAIVAWCEEHRVSCFRGNEMDVLDRYYRAACQYNAEAVVRITSDCPMIDPLVVDKTVSAFLSERPDYASNTQVRTYPRGLDTEVMSFAALERTWTEARHPYQRTHVTPYIYENPGLFKILDVTAETDHSAYRWTVDTWEDLEFIRAVYSRLRDEKFSFSDALNLMKREPELAEINQSVQQKALQEG
ncbi:MAG: glycosyltransferase family protein [Candidatus Sulfotelmatobacter sp.]